MTIRYEIKLKKAFFIQVDNNKKTSHSIQIVRGDIQQFKIGQIVAIRDNNSVEYNVIKQISNQTILFSQRFQKIFLGGRIEVIQDSDLYYDINLKELQNGKFIIIRNGFPPTIFKHLDDLDDVAILKRFQYDVENKLTIIQKQKQYKLIVFKKKIMKQVCKDQTAWAKFLKKRINKEIISKKKRFSQIAQGRKVRRFYNYKCLK
tara:strand:- start:529 stop:1140 length:612 start_codon:yes stop_codon:yes gene_type:complete